MEYYELLGIDENASQAEIDAAYSQLLRTFDPLTFEGDKEIARQMTIKLNEAYCALSTVGKRLDDSLASQVNNHVVFDNRTRQVLNKQTTTQAVDDNATKKDNVFLVIFGVILGIGLSYGLSILLMKILVWITYIPIVGGYIGRFLIWPSGNGYFTCFILNFGPVCYAYLLTPTKKAKKIVAIFMLLNYLLFFVLNLLNKEYFAVFCSVFVIWWLYINLRDF